MRGIEPPTNLVIRTYAPVRRSILIGALVVLGLFAMYVLFELGRYSAGYDQIAVLRERAEREALIKRLEKTNRELRTRIAELDTIRIGQARERAEVSRVIGELQAQVARQAQELTFYKGIVAPGAPASIGVQIQQLRIIPGSEPSRFRMRLTLVRSGRADDVANGTIVLMVEGESGGKAANLDLAALTGSQQREIKFQFRYFENLEQEITLPPGFKPERVTVEVRSSRRGVTPLSQTFLWSVDTL